MNTSIYKEALEKEKALLETELSGLGKRDPGNPSDWIPVKPEGDEFGADRNDNADIIEDMGDNSAALNELEGRLQLVEKALDKIEDGTYGVCEACGEEIEADRLKANPAATTCKVHMQ
jgi:DnaK suppressor protein